MSWSSYRPRRRDASHLWCDDRCEWCGAHASWPLAEQTCKAIPKTCRAASAGDVALLKRVESGTPLRAVALEAGLTYEVAKTRVARARAAARRATR